MNKIQKLLNLIDLGWSTYTETDWQLSSAPFPESDMYYAYYRRLSEENLNHGVSKTDYNVAEKMWKALQRSIGFPTAESLGRYLLALSEDEFASIGSHYEWKNRLAMLIYDSTERAVFDNLMYCKREMQFLKDICKCAVYPELRRPASSRTFLESKKFLFGLNTARMSDVITNKIVDSVVHFSTTSRARTFKQECAKHATQSDGTYSSSAISQILSATFKLETLTAINWLNGLTEEDSKYLLESSDAFIAATFEDTTASSMFGSLVTDYTRNRKSQYSTWRNMLIDVVKQLEVYLLTPREKARRLFNMGDSDLIALFTQERSTYTTRLANWVVNSSQKGTSWDVFFDDYHSTCNERPINPFKFKQAIYRAFPEFSDLWNDPEAFDKKKVEVILKFSDNDLRYVFSSHYSSDSYKKQYWPAKSRSLDFDSFRNAYPNLWVSGEVSYVYGFKQAVEKWFKYSGVSFTRSSIDQGKANNLLLYYPDVDFKRLFDRATPKDRYDLYSNWPEDGHSESFISDLSCYFSCGKLQDKYIDNMRWYVARRFSVAAPIIPDLLEAVLQWPDETIRSKFDNSVSVYDREKPWPSTVPSLLFEAFHRAAKPLWIGNYVADPGMFKTAVKEWFTYPFGSLKTKIVISEEMAVTYKAKALIATDASKPEEEPNPEEEKPELDQRDLDNIMYKARRLIQSTPSA